MAHLEVSAVSTEVEKLFFYHELVNQETILFEQCVAISMSERSEGQPSGSL